MVAMIDIEDLLPDVLTHAPSCPEPTALRFIRNAARDICQAGRLWRDTDSFQVTTPECEGLLTLTDAEIEIIENATLDGNPLEPKTVGWLDVNVPDWETADEETPARYITQMGPNAVTLVPKSSGLLRLRLVLKPSRTASMVPSFLQDQYGAELAQGAAGHILLMPNVEWSNPNLGAAHHNAFQATLDRIKITATKGQQDAPLRTRARFF